MAEEKKKVEPKPKEPTQEEARESAMNDLKFWRDVTNLVKQMRDNNCLAVSAENDIKNLIEDNTRAILGLEERKVYSPPAPIQQQHQQTSTYNVPQPQYR